MLGYNRYNPLGTPTINVSPSASISTTASTESTATAPTATPTATGVDKNASSGLNSLLNLATQGAQIAGTIKQQRQQSGASARRQSLIAQCGRRPLVGRQRKAEYAKCKADYEAGATTATGGAEDVNKTLTTQQNGSPMRIIWIGLAIAVAGGLGYMLYKKSK